MTTARQKRPDRLPSLPSKMEELAEFGQSIWIDSIDRRMLASGELQGLVDRGLRGLTSNPSIFEKAIGESTDYDPQIRELLSHRDLEVKELFDKLSIKDIQDAADILLPVYQASFQSAGQPARDGLVSLELAPFLAHDADGSVVEARRLWKEVNRPNLMIKVPATTEGLQAFERLIFEGISVNVTLLFSQSVYRSFAEAYLRALEARVEHDLEIESISSVASFFVSRIDSAVDKRSSKLPFEIQNALRGRIAIANARCAYQIYLELFPEIPDSHWGSRWERLRLAGAQPQRLLWASTSTKNPAYRDVLYLEELIGPNTVNTVPPATLRAFEDHGSIRLTLAETEDSSGELLGELEQSGISLDEVTDELTRDGIRLFAEPYGKLMATLEKKRRGLLRPTLNPMELRLPILLEAETGLQIERWQKEDRVRRLWRGDSSLWTGSNESSWLGWLYLQNGFRPGFEPMIRDFQKDVREAGFEDVVVLGMGGSSLCAILLSSLFDPADRFPVLHVLDSTDPAEIYTLQCKLDFEKTLFIVSSKSGSTLEPNLLLDYFYDLTKSAVGEKVGAHFIAITDPGTSLDSAAIQRGFRHVFHGIRDIGGRYSALSVFGMIPAAAMGLDVPGLMAQASAMAHSCSPNVPPEENPGLLLGLALGTLGRAGFDKITLICSPEIWEFGQWVEQLLAESTGKSGKGLIPICGEALGPPQAYGKDRAFVYMRLPGSIDRDSDAQVTALEAAEFPVIRIEVCDCPALSQEFFRWEFATAVAGSLLGINPFDQPDVESAKEETRRLMHEGGDHKGKAGDRPLASKGGIALFADSSNAEALSAILKTDEELPSVSELLHAHLSRLNPHDYLALLAYLPAELDTEEHLEELRRRIRDSYKVATSLGFGPRYLHSTGQIHKGGPDSGAFILITADPPKDLPIPGKSYTFGSVELAQALGDFEVLARKKRRIIRIHLSDRSFLKQIGEFL